MINDTTRRDVLVIGSANMDMVIQSDRFPRPGETVLGNDFAMFPGGKGANQATACARLGGRVHFIGKMGKDVFRDDLTRSMERDGIDLDALLVDDEASTGVAFISIDGSGENQITVVSGSNMRLRPDEIEAREDLFRQAAVVVLQLEIPLETVEKAVELGRKHGATVILNPAPARELPPSLLAKVDILTPNEIEASLLAGLEVDSLDTAEEAARRLLEKGVGKVIVTLGDNGALLVTPDTRRHFPVQTVEVVDTTAAGDAFSGALAFAVAEGRSIDDAIRLANAVATHTVTRLGAQASMPTMEEAKKYL